MTEEVRREIRKQLVVLKNMIHETRALNSVDMKDKAETLIQGRLDLINLPHCFREETSD